MTSFDKDTHRAAIALLTPFAKALVLSAQCLAMSSASKRLHYFGEGNGSCPFCGSVSSGILHEAWACPAFAKEQLEDDAYLSILRPHNMPEHTLLGLPEQLDASYSGTLLRCLPGQCLSLGDCPELCCDATLDNDTQLFLAQACSQHTHTATSIAYMLKAHATAPPPAHDASCVRGTPSARQRLLGW